MILKTILLLSHLVASNPTMIFVLLIIKDHKVDGFFFFFFLGVWGGWGGININLMEL